MRITNPIFWKTSTLLLIAYALCAMISNIFTTYFQADYLIPVLASLQKTTLFYWGQNRFALWISFFCQYIKDPYCNLYVQSVITGTTLISSLGILSWILFRKFWEQTFLLCMLILFSSSDWNLTTLLGNSQPYGTALFLGCLGLIAINSKFILFRLSSIVLFAASCLSNPGIVLILLLLNLLIHKNLIIESLQNKKLFRLENLGNLLQGILFVSLAFIVSKYIMDAHGNTSQYLSTSPDSFFWENIRKTSRFTDQLFFG